MSQGCVFIFIKIILCRNCIKMWLLVFYTKRQSMLWTYFVFGLCHAHAGRSVPNMWGSQLDPWTWAKRWPTELYGSPIIIKISNDYLFDLDMQNNWGSSFSPSSSLMVEKP